MPTPVVTWQLATWVSPQPAWSEMRSVARVMAGEVYAADGLDESQFIQQGWEIDDQAALAMYARKGISFARWLNGSFVIAVWGRVNRRVVLANDRFGLYRLYYAFHERRLIFAPEVKGILCDPEFPRQLDLTALAEYIRFQHLLGDRTFFEGISLFPSASTLTFDLQSVQVSLCPYWTYQDIPYRPDVPFEEAFAETGRLLKRAVRRLSEDEYRPGIYLSGGLDSRTILGMVVRRPLSTITYGVWNCRDVVYARRIAGKAGSNHYWCDPRMASGLKSASTCTWSLPRVSIALLTPTA